MPGEKEKDEKEKENETCAHSGVVTKYKLAGEIANAALKLVVSQVKPGAKIVDLCEAGDKYIEEECGKVFKDKKVSKGVGFPTCVSPNPVVGHFSPPAGDKTEVKVGDMIKIDLGCQIDGYVAVSATTVVVAEEGFAKGITGRQADVLMAAHVAAEVASRLVKAGAKGREVSEAINKVAEAYHVSHVLGVCSHNVSRNFLDGEKMIIPKPGEGEKPEDCEVGMHEAYVIDIVMSTGDGKPKEVSSDRTTIYMRARDTTYALKMKASRFVLSQVQEKHPHFPFNLRSYAATEDAAKYKMGIKECLEHGILTPYPVLEEKKDQHIAHLKFTTLIMPNGPLKITNPTLDVSEIKSDNKLTDETLVALLATAAKKKKKAKKKKPTGAAGASAPAAGGAAAAAEEDDGEDGDD